MKLFSKKVIDTYNHDKISETGTDTTTEVGSFSDDFQAEFSTEARTLESIAFEVMKKAPFTVQTLMEMVIWTGEEYETFGVGSILNTLSWLKNKVEAESITQEEFDSHNMITLLFILGAEIKIDGKKLLSRTPSNRRRVEKVLSKNGLHYKMPEALAFIEFIENQNDIMDKML